MINLGEFDSMYGELALLKKRLDGLEDRVGPASVSVLLASTRSLMRSIKSLAAAVRIHEDRLDRLNGTAAPAPVKRGLFLVRRPVVEVLALVDGGAFVPAPAV